MERWALVFVVLLAACSTRPNRESTINVPSGLNESAVELAVIMAVLDATKPPDMTVGQQITDNVLSSVLRGYTSMRTRNAWFYEAREPGSVYAGFQHRGYYMRVKADYSASNVILKIVESRGLDQNRDRIHKSALRWMGGLEDRIRRSLGNVAQQKLIQELARPAT